MSTETIVLQHVLPNEIFLNVDGADGADGTSGEDGEDGRQGSDGEHGRSATNPTNGKDGDDLILTLKCRNQGDMVHVHAITTKGSVIWDQIYPLDNLPSIRWSSRGGKGGNGGVGGYGGDGALGKDGIDATKETPGTNAQNGGDGGDGGEGTNGANGGKAGSMTIMVEPKDAFLLMAVEPCKFDSNALRGGAPGEAGEHGKPGKGAPGGKGGKHFVYEDPTPILAKRVQNKIPGGKDGTHGVVGHVPTWDLISGREGATGTFKIVVAGDDERYDGRYHVTFAGLGLHGCMEVDDACEFGDVISVSRIKIKNTGQMPIPSSQWISFQVKDSGDQNVNPIRTSKACIPSGSFLDPGEEMVADGVLQFFSGFPNDIANPDDFDPIIHTTSFSLQAFQWGPVDKKDQTPFKYEYENFHSGPGYQIKMRYPVENHSGMLGVSSLFPCEETLLKLQIDNIGGDTMGGFSSISTSSNRRLAVRFVLNGSEEYDIRSDQINFNTRSTGMQNRKVDLSDRGKILDLPEVQPNSSYDFTARMSFKQNVKYYSRAALQVEILIKSLPLPRGILIDHDMPQMSVVQRRKFELVCEPKYESVANARVVLVTSFATSLKQYEAWSDEVLKKPMDLLFETFSISRYGTLDPSFVVENGKTLKENFCGKLVIVLNEKYKIDQRDATGIHPVQLFNRGCMSQNSGFDSTTTWLIVGGGNATSNRDLLESHLANEVSIVAEHADVAQYQKVLQQEVLERSLTGHGSSGIAFREDVIHITLPVGEKAARAPEKAAKKLCEWLRDTDPLCQYTIEYEGKKEDSPQKGLLFKRATGLLTVRRGFCRTSNSVVVVSGMYTFQWKSITSKGMLLSIAESMTRELRVALLCDAIRKSLATEVLTAFKYAAVSAMVRDMVTFVDCNMKLTEDLDLSFPAVAVFLESVEVLSLLRDCKADKELHERTSEEFSELFARFELVSRSKDLRPRFTLTGRTQKKTAVEAMTEIVDRLRLHWKTVLDISLVEMHKKEIKAEIKEFLKEDIGEGKSVNVRADQRWIQGLNYVHSTDNQKQFGVSNQSKRLIELDFDGEVENFKILPPSVRTISSDDMQNLLRNQTLRQELGRSVIEDIQLTRKNMCIVWEDDMEDVSVWEDDEEET